MKSEYFQITNQINLIKIIDKMKYNPQTAHDREFNEARAQAPDFSFENELTKPRQMINADYLICSVKDNVLDLVLKTRKTKLEYLTREDLAEVKRKLILYTNKLIELNEHAVIAHERKENSPDFECGMRLADKLEWEIK